MTRPEPHPLAFPALLFGNITLAFGPWLVRLADVGAVAAGFWRLTLAIPFLWLLAQGTGQPQFQAFLHWMDEDPDVWCKVSCPERLSLSGPPYDDVVAFQQTIVERFPDRVLWGTDWPHPNLKGHMADDGVLVDQIPKFATTSDLRQRLLVDNPMRLYWDR